MTEHYRQQMLSGDRATAFRNSNDEPWVWYDTPPNGAVLSFDSQGHYPLPDWNRRDV